MTTIGEHSLRIDAPRAEIVDGRLVLRTTLRVEMAVTFGLQLRLRLEASSIPALGTNSNDTFYVAWLPRGAYRVDVMLPAAVTAGVAQYRLEAWHQVSMTYESADSVEGAVDLPVPPAGAPDAFAWSIEGLAPTRPLSDLSWRKGHSDWFFRHFDHAGPTVMSYMLGDSPLLRGRILDVGCGDGITDLSIALRTGCSELVGIDPFRGYERLAGIAIENHLPADVLPKNLRFMPESGNAIPFEDDSFDVVISWGSVEHIAGGYMGTLREIRRVLKPNGLFFVHPGLYYSNYGHHLGEFSSEPHFHLKRPLEEVKKIVLDSKPNYMDRSGEFSSPQQYWQWFRELNPITVSGFEQELRALDFQPWRVALRTEGLVEYTPEIERYPMQDLATCELYVSCVNRKRPR